MAVRPHPTKQGAFQIDFRPFGIKGPRERLMYVGTEEGARNYEIELTQQSKPLAAENVLSTKVGDLYSLYLQNLKNNSHSQLKFYKGEKLPGTVIDFIYAWNRLRPHFANQRVVHLTLQTFEDYKTLRLAAKIKKKTINRELSYLSSMIKCGVEHKKCKPLQFKIPFFPKRQTKPDIPIVHTIDETQAIIENIPTRRHPLVKDLLTLIYDHGLRRSEGFNLIAENINLGQDREKGYGWFKVVGKGTKERIIPVMTERSYEILTQRLREVKKGYLFLNPETGEPYKDLRAALKSASKTAKVSKKITHHLLRHDWGTHAMELNIDPRATQAIMGHEDQATTAIYTHIAMTFLGKEGKKMGDEINRRNKPVKPEKKKKPARADK